MILIVSHSGDLHALTILKKLRLRGCKSSFFLETDRIANRSAVSLSIKAGKHRGSIQDTEGNTLLIADAKIIWLRRTSLQQELPNASDQVSEELIHNDCRDALSSVLELEFKGKWISCPDSTFHASNKIYQLAIASECGFRIPSTLISQSRDEVVRFAEINNGKIIVKTIVGTDKAFLLTRLLDDPCAIDEASYRACPAIYQELITGTRHIRLNCFGDASFAARIESPDLDWRPNLQIPMSIWPVPDGVHRMVRKVLDALGLEMGIVDLKESSTGELVWLEVNPQGQFLFLEPLAQLPLSDIFTEYLIREEGAL